jgi:hypothetical protein
MTRGKALSIGLLIMAGKFWWNYLTGKGVSTSNHADLIDRFGLYKSDPELDDAWKRVETDYNQRGLSHNLTNWGITWTAVHRPLSFKFICSLMIPSLVLGIVIGALFGVLI